jgi:hypothetical protein
MNWKTGGIYWKLESSVWKLDVVDVDGNWIEKPLVVFQYQWRSAPGVIQDSEMIVSGVKIKTVLVISNIFFQIFLLLVGGQPSFGECSICKPLLNKGFKLPDRGFKGLFFFSVEPPFRGGSFHQGIDIPHSYEVPDAF